ncbi:hypothetical protein [Sphingomonas sp. Leaf17]|uniref:hypothetical protein n=1 Tax=Sphingomonas sp. Leaf17 TaxID=1735683 RepID=UPI0012E2F561|nr:hypothetical protein [Sphingomonas sp. Leaf17]
MILLLVSGQQNNVQSASSKLSVTCRTERCGEPEKRSPYRLEADDVASSDSKGRAIDDGTKCNVVGSRVCTRKPRTVFSTAIDK